MINKTQTIKLHGTWDGNCPDHKYIEEFTIDFKNLFGGKIIWEPDEDGWIIIFIKESE